MRMEGWLLLPVPSPIFAVRFVRMRRIGGEVPAVRPDSRASNEGLRRFLNLLVESAYNALTFKTLLRHYAKRALTPR